MASAAEIVKKYDPDEAGYDRKAAGMPSFTVKSGHAQMLKGEASESAHVFSFLPHNRSSQPMDLRP